MQAGRVMSLAAAFSVIMILVSSGCTTQQAPGGGQQAGTDANRTLRVVVHQWMVSKYLIDQAAQEFEKDHPGVRVQVSTMDNKDPLLFLSAWRSGTVEQDLLMGWEASSLKPYVKEGMLETWDAFIDENYQRTDFVNAFLELGKLDGKVYVVPMTGEVMAVTVRRDLMEKAGFTDADGEPIPPADWDEFYEYAKKMTDGDVTGGCIMSTGLFMSQDYMYGLQAAKGSIFGPDGSMLDMSSETARDMLDAWQRGIADGYLVKDTSTCRTGMKQGKVAMLVATHSRWPEVENEMIVEGSITIMPLLYGGRGSLAFMHGLWIPEASENKDLAMQFAKEQILKDDYMKWTLENYGKMSPLVSTYEGLSDERWVMLMGEAQNAAVTPPYTDYSKLNDIMLLEIGKMLDGNQTVDETLANMREGAGALDLSTG